jgi:hypothetical protein
LSRTALPIIGLSARAPIEVVFVGGVVAQLLAAGVDLVGATNVQAFRRLVSRGTHGPAH